MLSRESVGVFGLDNAGSKEGTLALDAARMPHLPFAVANQRLAALRSPAKAVGRCESQGMCGVFRSPRQVDEPFTRCTPWVHRYSALHPSTLFERHRRCVAGAG